MAETRVDLKHLLEDIRDSYPCPVQEAILTEMIANSLDSGCSEIEIRIEPEQHRLTFMDNGEGMTLNGFERYHDIASTTKARGKGIGFAGVGAKLALLLCREVLTETRRARSSHCSRWWLETNFRAPWEEMGGLVIVSGEKGTAVRLHMKDRATVDLFSVKHLRDAIRGHFYPLLDTEFAKVLSAIYPRGIKMKINGDPVTLPKMKREAGEYFVVRQGKRRKLLGIGFLMRVRAELPEEQRGLAVSTFGKVIKRGWEWLGVTPKNPSYLTGVVEIPELVECLTTNKCDFMRDPNSLQKYYKYRKAVQDEVSRVLDTLGETRPTEHKPDKSFEKLQKEIEKVVGEVLPDFPELAPLFGRKQSGTAVPAFVSDSQGVVPVGTAEGTDAAAGDKGGPGEGGGIEGAIAGPLEGSHPEIDEKSHEHATEQKARRKKPGLMIGFDEETGGDAMAHLEGSTLYINALHPAYKRVKGSGNSDLYITFAVASTLSTQVEENRPPFEFLQRFMCAWGNMK